MVNDVLSEDAQLTSKRLGVRLIIWLKGLALLLAVLLQTDNNTLMVG